MNIMDKFASVEIKVDNRISEEDKAFCTLHQEAFDKAGPALQRIAEAMTAAKAEQQAILGGDNDRHSHLSTWGKYISSEGFHCDECSVYEMMEKRNKRFIKAIVDYFSSKYTVELDASEIMEHLIPAGPQEPKLPLWGGYSRMSDKEIKDFKEQMKVYTQEEKRHNVALQTLPLRYEQIVDEIFVQLGGFSFQERAMVEFLGKCWDASHNYRGDKENFEIKNDTLILTGYWCRCNNENWRQCATWESTEDLKVILDAIVHYNIGQLNRGSDWFPELFRFYTEKNIFCINTLEKVRKIKLFKNRRVDIKFDSSVSVQEFVETYLRKHIE